MAFCLDEERNQAWRRSDHGVVVCAVCCVYLHEIDGQGRLEYMTLLMRDNEMMEKGREEGRKDVLFSLVKDGTLAPEIAAIKADMSAEEFVKAMKEAGY